MGKWKRYSQMTEQWLRKHPYATPQEYEQACRAIAARLGL